jgi:hypothetical protein
MLLLDKLHRRMKADNIGRKVILKLNREFWDPNPKFLQQFRKKGWVSNDENTLELKLEDSDDECVQ